MQEERNDKSYFSFSFAAEAEDNFFFSALSKSEQFILFGGEGGELVVGVREMPASITFFRGPVIWASV